MIFRSFKGMFQSFINVLHNVIEYLLLFNSGQKVYKFSQHYFACQYQRDNYRVSVQL